MLHIYIYIYIYVKNEAVSSKDEFEEAFTLFKRIKAPGNNG